MASSHSLSRLFSPRAVAVIGASASPGKVGHEVMKALSGAGVPVHPVHPRAEEILGRAVFPDIESIPGDVDLAVIATGADTAVAAANSCAEHGVPFVVVLASGFSETGEEGSRREDSLKRVTMSGTRILGPNTLGLQVPHTGVDTVFVDHATDSVGGGAIALVSQSGSVAVEALLAANRYGFGLRAFVGLGNKLDLAEIDFLHYFADDPETRCVALYMEDLSAGRPFLTRAREIASDKPVLVIKAGRTAAGASAASSHTGRLSGADRVIDGALAQHLIQREDDDESLFDAAKALDLCPVPAGNRVAVLSAAGGYGVMLADLVETPTKRVELRMARLAPATVETLGSVMAGFASANNPVDLTASVDNTTVVAALRALLADPGVDIVVYVHFLAPPALTPELTPQIAEVVGSASKPVVVLAGDEDGTGSVLRALHDLQIAAYPSVARAGTALRALERRRTILELAGQPGGTAAGSAAVGAPAADDLHPLPRDGITEIVAKHYLSQFGIAFPRSRLLGPGDQVDTILHAIPGPYVVKVSSEQVLHKTESGGVRLNVHADALSAVVEEMRSVFPGSDMLIEQMVKHAGVEIICGAFKDPELGPCAMVGGGGVLAELQEDVAFRLLPCTPADVRDMVGELRIGPLFEGFRGIDCAIGDLEAVVVALGRAVVHLGRRFQELDLNPIVCTPQGLVALDAMIMTGPTAPQ